MYEPEEKKWKYWGSVYLQSRYWILVSAFLKSRGVFLYIYIYILGLRWVFKQRGSNVDVTSISVSHSARPSLTRPPFKQWEVCQVPNPSAGRSKVNKGTGDLLSYCGRAKKMESLIDWDIAFFPPFLPWQLFHLFNPPLWLWSPRPPSSPLSVFPPPIHILLVSKLKHIGSKGCDKGGGGGSGELMSSLFHVVGISLFKLVAPHEGKDQTVDTASAVKRKSAQKLTLQW